MNLPFPLDLINHLKIDNDKVKLNKIHHNSISSTSNK